MAIRSGFFNSVNGDRKYDAKRFAEYFASFIGNGVFPNPSDGLQVIANNDMTVTVKAGKCWINGYIMINDDDYILEIEPADGVLNRIDRVVARYDVVDREIRLEIKKGTFASNPVAPELQRDADAYELGLADIYVNNGIISLTQDNIVDLRSNSNYCGIVHGTIAGGYNIDYEYQTPTIVGTQIQITRKTGTKRLFFKLNEDLLGNITISLDGGVTEKPLVDIENNLVTKLEKGFVEVVESPVNFTLRPRGGDYSSGDILNYADVEGRHFMKFGYIHPHIKDMSSLNVKGMVMDRFNNLMILYNCVETYNAYMYHYYLRCLDNSGNSYFFADIHSAEKIRNANIYIADENGVEYVYIFIEDKTLYKYDTAGRKIWVKNNWTPLTAVYYDIFYSDNTGIYVGARQDAYGVVQKINFDGSVAWQHKYNINTYTTRITTNNNSDNVVAIYRVSNTEDYYLVFIDKHTGETIVDKGKFAMNFDYSDFKLLDNGDLLFANGRCDTNKNIIWKLDKFSGVILNDNTLKGRDVNNNINKYNDEGILVVSSPPTGAFNERILRNGDIILDNPHISSEAYGITVLTETLQLP